MNIPQTTPTEAQRLLQQGHRYLDVRTEMEFAKGHPAAAVNVPVAIPDPRTQQMVLNPDFLKVVEANFSKEMPIVVGCQSGGRSQRAAEMMAAAGYTSVTNMQGGFGGGMDPTTGAAVAGWVQCGLPVCSQCAPGDSYAEAASKAS